MNAHREKPLKLLFVHHSAKPGGAEFSLFDLVSNIDRTRITPIIALPDNGPLVSRFEELGLKVYRVNMNRIKKSYFPLQMFKLYRNLKNTGKELYDIVKSESIDMIHVNSLKAGLYFRFGIRNRIPQLIWHERDLVQQEYLGRKLSEICSLIIAISDSVSDKIKNYIPDKSKVVRIYNGIKIENFACENMKTRNQLKLPEKGKIILLPAQFVPWKRHDDLIRAAEIVLKKHSDATFILSGMDSYNDHPDYIASLQKMTEDIGIKENVHFPGFIEDIPSLLAHTYALVLPAVEEPFGRVLIEAMAASVPVVAVESNGPKELIEDGKQGLLVPPGDIEELAKAIINLLDDEKKAKLLGFSGKEHVTANFSIKNTVSQFMDMVDEVFDKREVS